MRMRMVTRKLRRMVIVLEMLMVMTIMTAYC